MSSSPYTGLRVRQHHRREVELPIEFVVAEGHRRQVKFSASSSAVDDHTLRGTSVDISPGGLGFNCRQFLPRMCDGTLRIYDPTPVGARTDGTPMLQVAFEQLVKVRRVQMTSHAPTYLIGVSFAEPEAVDPEIGSRMALLQGGREPGDGGDGAAEGPHA